MKKLKYLLIPLIAIMLVFVAVGCKKKSNNTVTDPETVTVTFYVNDSVYSTENVEKDSSVNELELKGGENYTFSGWYTDSGLTTKATFPVKAVKNLAFYGEWSEMSYTLSFDTKGGSAIEPQTYYKNEYLTRPADPVYTGHRFLGWFTDEACTKQYDFIKKQMPAHDLTLYAGWQDLIKVEFDPDNGEDTIVYYVGEGETISPFADPKWTGHVFIGWYDEKDQLMPPLEMITGFLRDVKFKAHWRDRNMNVSVHYYNLGEELEELAYTAQEGDAFKQPSGAPARDDAQYFVFEGWFLDELCTKKVEFGENFTPVNGENNVINLYAGWHRNAKYARIEFTVLGDGIGSIYVEKGITFAEALAEQLEHLTLPAYTQIDGYYSALGFTYTDTSIVVMDMVLEGNVYSTGLKFTETEDGVARVTGHEGLQGTTLYIPKFYHGLEVYEIAENALSGIPSTTIYGLERIQVIGAGALKNSTGISSVDVSAATYIGDGAFEGCTALAEVTLSSAIRWCGKNVFDGTQYSGNAQEGYTLYGDYVLARVDNLTAQVTLPNTVVVVASEAAMGNTSLTSINGVGVLAIGNSAFEGCTTLKSAFFSNKSALTKVGARAFYGCIKFDMLRTQMLRSPLYATEIGEYAFYGCTGISSMSITFASVVRVIGAHAFENCTNLTKLKIPVTVQSIGDSAFAGCTALTDVLIGESTISEASTVNLTSIGANAFADATQLKYFVVYTHLVEDALFSVGENWLPLPSEADYTFYVTNVVPATNTASKYYSKTSGMKPYVNIFKQEMPAYADALHSVNDIKPVIEIVLPESTYTLTVAEGYAGFNILSFISGNYTDEDGKKITVVNLTNDITTIAGGQSTSGSQIWIAVNSVTDSEGAAVAPMSSGSNLYRLAQGEYTVEFVVFNGYNQSATDTITLKVT